MQGRDDRADAAAGHPVDVQPGVRQLPEHPDVGERPGATARQHEAQRPTGESVGERPQADGRVAASTQVSCQASVAATHAARCAMSGAGPTSTRSGWRDRRRLERSGRAPQRRCGRPARPRRPVAGRSRSRPRRRRSSAPSATRTTRSCSRLGHAPGRRDRRRRGRPRDRCWPRSVAPARRRPRRHPLPGCRPTTATTRRLGGPPVRRRPGRGAQSLGHLGRARSGPPTGRSPASPRTPRAAPPAP